MIPSYREIEPYLAPHIRDFSDCSNKAVGDYLRLDPLHRAKHLPRTRASIISDSTIFYISELEEKKTDLTWWVWKGHRRLLIQDRVHVRFKKLNRNFETRNASTQMALDYLNQDSQLNLPGMPPPLVKVFVGYQWNAVETGITGIYVVCPNGLRNAWVERIYQPDQQVDEPVNLHEQGELPVGLTRQVRSRSAEKRSQQNS